MTCTANKKDGDRCCRPAMRGREVCHSHSELKVGRPSALTPEVHERVVKLVKVGCSGEVAAQAAGMSASTYYKLLKEGRERESGPEQDFVAALDQARAEAFAHAMTALRREIATPGNYRAAVAYIDRFHRGRFDDRRPGGGSNGASPGGRQSGEQRLELSRLSEEQLAFLEDLYGEAAGEGEGA